MNPPMVVRTPIGHCHTSKIVPKTIVEIEGIEFLASPIILKSSTLYCGTKSVQLFHPSGEIVNQTTRITRDAETQIYMLNALNVSPLDGIENVPVIRDFL